jgi:hypothetical protein
VLVNPPRSFRGLSDFGESGDQHLLKAVLIYEDIAAGVRARWFCQKLARALDCALEEKMWNFHVLGIREIRNSSAIAARSADIVVVSVSGHTELPGTIRVWLEMWLLLLRKKKPALVGLFNLSSRQRSASFSACLRRVAERGGIDFFPRQMSAPGGQEPILIFSGTKPSTAQ